MLIHHHADNVRGRRRNSARIRGWSSSIDAKKYIPNGPGRVIRQVHAGKKRIPTEIATHLAEHLSDEALTDREIEVLKHIVGGNRNRDIAEQLLISEETVKVHIKHIMEKLGASDRTQAVAIAVRRGIIQLMMADTISVARKHPGVAESNRARVILRS